MGADPAFPHAPLELYGYRTVPPTTGALAAKAHEQCPFLGRKCRKCRKSDPSQSIGTCVVGAGGRPQVSCPSRFLDEGGIFTDVAHLLGGGDGAIWAVPEVNLPEFGSIDFMVVRGHEHEVKDFVGLEIQALDTTGSTFQGREDFYAGQMAERYKYGINWKMTAKLVLVQTAHKAPVFGAWGKKLVWILQDTLLEYLQGAFDFSGFHDEDPADTVLWYAYSLDAGADRFQLRPTTRLSGNLGAVTSAMGAKAAAGQELLQSTVASMLGRYPTWRPVAP